MGVPVIEPGDPWQQERELAELWDHAEHLEAVRISRGECPRCQEPIETEHRNPVADCETFVKRCTFCDWKGNPE